MSVKANPTIPIIDLSGLGDPQEDSRIATSIATAYGEIGFGYMVNHGIPTKLVDDVFAASRRFHALPQAEKMQIAVNHAHRGFIPINSSTDVTSDLAEVKKPNQSQSFMMMREDERENPAIFLSGPNQWPEETPSLAPFRAPVTAYHDAMCELARQITRITFIAAGIDPSIIMPAFDSPTSWLRLLHYPPLSIDSPDDLYSAAPHRDFGALTLLAQDEVGGLQVMTQDGDWLDAPRLECSFVANIGNMMHRMTNGRLLSTPHQVINRTGQERYSCPFFFDPHVSTEIRPLPGTGTARFDPIRFYEFLRSELGASYEEHKARP